MSSSSKLASVPSPPCLSFLGLTRVLTFFLLTSRVSFNGDNPDISAVFILYRLYCLRFLSISTILSFVLRPEDVTSDVKDCSELVSYSRVNKCGNAYIDCFIMQLILEGAYQVLGLQGQSGGLLKVQIWGCWILLGHQRGETSALARLCWYRNRCLAWLNCNSHLLLGLLWLGRGLGNSRRGVSRNICFRFCDECVVNQHFYYIYKRGM